MIATYAPTTWRRALERAERDGITVEKLAEFGDIQWFKATSSKGTFDYSVFIVGRAQGVDVRCNCAGGQHKLICKHGAVAMRAAGLLPDPMLIEVEPEPDEPFPHVSISDLYND